MTITIERQGRRIYLRGDTYAIRDQLRSAGAKWDPDVKCWYTGRQTTADAIVAELGGGTSSATSPQRRRDDRLVDDSVVAGRARYKGREYLLVWEGETRRGPAAKLAFLDGSSMFWAGKGEYEITKIYQTRERYGRDEPMTFGRLSRLREEFRDQKQAAETQSVVGETGPIAVEYTGSRAHRAPPEAVGSSRWIVHRGSRVACTLIGYETAVFVRGEDAEDMGNFGVSDGWYGTSYYRPATDAEQAALEVAEAPKRSAQRSVARRAVVESWLASQLRWDAPGVTLVSDTGSLPPASELVASVRVGRKVSTSGAVTDGGTTYALTMATVVAHHGGYYDDYRSSTRTVTRTDELAQVIEALAGDDVDGLAVCADRIEGRWHRIEDRLRGQVAQDRGQVAQDRGQVAQGQVAQVAQVIEALAGDDADGLAVCADRIEGR